MKKLKLTPRYARIYLLAALLLIAAPTIMYKLLPSHSGKVLVAAPQSNDVNFARTLVYIHSHHGYGAQGFILNKPLDLSKAQEAQKKFPFAKLDQLYAGGPIESEHTYFFVLPDNEQWRGIKIIDANALQSKYPERYNAIVKDPEITENMRILSGYSGWFGFQLNREIVRGGWDILDYDASLFYGLSQDKSWRRAVERVAREKKVIEPSI